MKDDNIAKCIRLLLEIEDCNIQAKKSYGKYSDYRCQRLHRQFSRGGGAQAGFPGICRHP